MQKITTFFGLLVIILSLNNFVILGQETKQPLKNEDIVKMVKEGFTDTLVIQTIQQFPAGYDVSPNALIEMKKQGISNAVLEAMSKANSNKTTSTSLDKEKQEKSEEKKEKKSLVLNDFVFELNVCQSSGGDSLTCWFSITNKGRERQITLTLNSYIVDDLRGQYSATNLGIGNSYRRYQFEDSVTNTIASQVSVGAVLVFENVKTQSKFIKFFRISCSSEDKKFNIDFRDIPITVKPQTISSPKTENNQENSMKSNLTTYKEGETANSSAIASEKESAQKQDLTSISANPKNQNSFSIKYRQSYFLETDVTKKEDLCGGQLLINEGSFELTLESGKSFQGKDCPSIKYSIKKDKFLELKDSSREKWYGNYLFSDYVYMRFVVPDEKNEDKEKIKEILIYPTDATVVLGTRTYNPFINKVVICSNCPAIVCKTCEAKLTEMKQSLLKLAKTSRLKIDGKKVRTGEK